MYEDFVTPKHVLVFKCENGYGIDLTMIVEGDLEQRTYIASSLEEALVYVKRFFSPEGDQT